MTDMELNARIAELVGWKPEIVDVCYTVGHIHHELSEMPDYPNDLNAMHEAENLMTEAQKYRYDTVLENRTKYHSDPPRWRWNATARQRAEAYVKVMEGDK
jgi:hypothetical protein